ncbi:hypothetical protein ACR2XV_25785, partial [Klebsiella pneumoniae]
MSSHSTKNQLKEKSPEAKFILSSTLHALLLFKIQKVQKVQSFSLRQTRSRGHSAPWRVAPRPLLPGRSTARPLGRMQASVAVSLAGVGSFCGGCATRGGQRG